MKQLNVKNRVAVLVEKKKYNHAAETARRGGLREDMREIGKKIIKNRMNARFVTRREINRVALRYGLWEEEIMEIAEKIVEERVKKGLFKRVEMLAIEYNVLERNREIREEFAKWKL